MIGHRESSPADRWVAHQVRVSPLTGTASLTVPIRTSPGRESFGPALALVHGGGRVNSPFGVGWGLSGVPSIGVDTSRSLARYDDAQRYVFTGGQRLVPASPTQDRGSIGAVGDGFRVRRFRSQVERSFERFERWTHVDSGRTHWLAYARNGVVSVFGAAADGSSRIADPADPDRRTSQWLLEAQLHPKGNAIVFDYAKEDAAGIDRDASFEVRRGPSAQRYLKRIRYGNDRPRTLADLYEATTEWHFEVVFDYGEHDEEPPSAVPSRRWPSRPDPFSTHRPGFGARATSGWAKAPRGAYFPSVLRGESLRVRSAYVVLVPEERGASPGSLVIEVDGVTADFGAPPSTSESPDRFGGLSGRRIDAAFTDGPLGRHAITIASAGDLAASGETALLPDALHDLLVVIEYGL
ncbi:MAG: SpvB/TcaC N-terminal domain-containing protein [Sandaracinaceae bacterium]